MVDNQEKKSLIEVRVRGKNLALWRKKRSELMDRIREKAFDTFENIMAKQIDPIEKTSIKEELDQLISKSLSFVKGKLAMPNAQIEKTFAEIHKTYIEIEKETVEIRRTQAVAEREELKNEMIKLKWALGSTKIFLSSDDDEESIFFLKEIEEWEVLIEQVTSMF